MKDLRSWVTGSWHEAKHGFVSLVNPSTEAPLARVSSAGIDFRRVLEHARQVGGPGLRAMSFAQRAELLKAMSTSLRGHREELLDLSLQNNGTTVSDGAFDIDGATGTLAYYAALGRSLGDRWLLEDGESVPLSREGNFRGQHVWVPRKGVAVHVNAFNFPAWGMAEKAACALLAGMPVVTKPASATALVAHRMVEILVEEEVLPAGSLQLICGATGDLLHHLGSQDIVAFTGSADTARVLRRELLGADNARFNCEADSLNAAILGPATEIDGPVWETFVREIGREIQQKAGQKCTAIRRVVVPHEMVGIVEEAIVARLGSIVTGNPADESVTMGPLATQSQLADALSGLAQLLKETRLLCGTGARRDGVGSEEGKGYFLGPTLLRLPDAFSGRAVHEHEVFGPVATLMTYDGSSAQAAAIAALGGGTLVTSLYGHDEQWLGETVAAMGDCTGRIYVCSPEAVGQTPGSGAALPQVLHGGPGRAGGGEELGGLIGVRSYLQRQAVQGAPTILGRLLASAEGG